MPRIEEHPPRSRRSAHLIASAVCALLAVGVALMIGALPIHAQTTNALSRVKKVYVEPLGQGKLGIDFQERVIARLRKGGSFAVVETPGQADAVISGSGEIWVTGYDSSNPRSPAKDRQPVYSGFLSARVTDKKNDVLWSYLVTPKKFAWGGIVHDLADSLAAKLIESRQERNDAAVATLTPDAGAQTIHGAGATFPAPLYQKWFESFQQRRPNTRIVYDGIGSEAGIRMLAEGKVDFAASDMPLTDQRMAQLGVKFQHFPSVLGAVVPIYNLAGVSRPLNFTPETLAEIYLGKIKRWSDAKIRAVNRGFSLPDSEIVVVHRSDGSGTSFVWSDFLSKVSPEWKAAVGSGSELKWPIGVGAEHSEGVALRVHQTPNAIGYVEMVFALQHQLSFGAVRNAAGEFVRASLSSVTAAAASGAGTMTSDFRISITNAPGAGAYPISSFTWLLFPQDLEAGKKSALLELTQWILTSGQKECSELGYAPLPREVVEQELKELSGVR